MYSGANGRPCETEDRARPKQFTEIHSNFELLAAAIVQQACIDYTKAKDVNTHGGVSRREIERFIRSDYFKTICDINPSWLLTKLREKIRAKAEVI